MTNAPASPTPPAQSYRRPTLGDQFSGFSDYTVASSAAMIIPAAAAARASSHVAVGLQPPVVPVGGGAVSSLAGLAENPTFAAAGKVVLAVGVGANMYFAYSDSRAAQESGAVTAGRVTVAGVATGLGVAGSVAMADSVAPLLASAEIGALVGTSVPVIGTAVGFLAGLLVGAVVTVVVSNYGNDLVDAAVGQ